ncbi:unnamed protein product [Fusarium venenatum]|uniref:Uncharacterized protein n=1 Tax=Fusarium venenatum TaxID=56646 RepID=A0A2L2T9M7_9HYPO|nr:LOW QUALITY PROTEIN: uncharacterized protein FVRRES_03071 [Fusarium venenatum]CEI66559.1 unnamed protein product [Fusarium venenatum]
MHMCQHIIKSAFLPRPLSRSTCTHCPHGLGVKTLCEDSRAGILEIMTLAKKHHPRNGVRRTPVSIKTTEMTSRGAVESSKDKKRGSFPSTSISSTRYSCARNPPCGEFLPSAITFFKLEGQSSTCFSSGKPCGRDTRALQGWLEE